MKVRRFNRSLLIRNGLEMQKNSVLLATGAITCAVGYVDSSRMAKWFNEDLAIEGPDMKVAEEAILVDGGVYVEGYITTTSPKEYILQALVPKDVMDKFERMEKK